MSVVSFGAVLLVMQPTAIFGSTSQHHQASTAELVIGYTALAVGALISGVDCESASLSYQGPT